MTQGEEIVSTFIEAKAKELQLLARQNELLEKQNQYLKGIDSTLDFFKTVSILGGLVYVIFY